MIIIPLYKYIRPDGGITVSPVEPQCEYTTMSRLVADENMELIKGDAHTTCADVENDDVPNWHEEPIEPDSDEQM